MTHMHLNNTLNGKDYITHSTNNICSFAGQVKGTNVLRYFIISVQNMFKSTSKDLDEAKDGCKMYTMEATHWKFNNDPDTYSAKTASGYLKVAI